MSKTPSFIFAKNLIFFFEIIFFLYISLILSFFVTYIIGTYLGIEEIRLVKVAVSAFKKKRRLRDIKKNNRKAKKTTFESVVENDNTINKTN